LDEPGLQTASLKYRKYLFDLHSSGCQSGIQRQ
jgi:hypothetical protein